jgi:hypothetical protein
MAGFMIMGIRRCGGTNSLCYMYLNANPRPSPDSHSPCNFTLGYTEGVKQNNKSALLVMVHKFGKGIEQYKHP